MNVRDLVVRLAPFAVHAGVVFCTLGMMFVIAGVLTSGLFLPGVALIIIGILKFTAAAVFSALGWLAPRAE